MPDDLKQGILDYKPSTEASPTPVASNPAPSGESLRSGILNYSAKQPEEQNNTPSPQQEISPVEQDTEDNQPAQQLVQQGKPPEGLAGFAQNIPFVGNHFKWMSEPYQPLPQHVEGRQDVAPLQQNKDLYDPITGLPSRQNSPYVGPLVGNAIKGMADTATGALALGAVIPQRVLEYATQGKPLLRTKALSQNEPADTDFWAKAFLEDFPRAVKQNVFDPIIHKDFEGINQEFGHYPFEALINTPYGPNVAAMAAKGLGNAVKTVAPKIAASAGEAMTKSVLGGMVSKFAQHEKIQQFAHAVNSVRKFNTILKDAFSEYEDWITTMIPEIQRLYKEVPTNLRADLINASEQMNITKWNEIVGDEANWPPSSSEEQLKRLQQNPRHDIGLSQLTPVVYHETSIDELEYFLPNGSTAARMDQAGVWLTNAKEFATGQGSNKGVLLEFDTTVENPNGFIHKTITGRISHNKPTSQLMLSQGKAEFYAHREQKTFANSLRRITIKYNAKGTGYNPARVKRHLDELVRNEGWIKTTTPEGVIYDSPLNFPKQTKLAISQQSTTLANPAAKAFVDKVQEFTTGISNLLVQHGLLTEDDILFARYGGPAMAAEKRVNGTKLTFKDLYDNKEVWKPRLLELKAAMDAHGITPLYWSIRTIASVDRWLDEHILKPFNIPKLKGREVDTSFLHARERGLTEEEPGMFKLRAEKEEEQADRLAIDMLSRMWKTLIYFRALKDIAEHPVFKKSTINWEELPVGRWIEEVGKKIGNSGSPAIQAAINARNVIFLPGKIARAVGNIAGNFESNPNWYRAMATIYKRTLLGLDPWFSSKMLMATVGMLAIGTQKNITDIPRLFIAATLAFNTRVKNALPLEILTESGRASKLKMEMPQIDWKSLNPARQVTGFKLLAEASGVAFEKLRDIINPFNWAKWNFQLTDNFINWGRYTFAIHESLREIDRLPPQTQNALFDALKLSAMVEKFEKGVGNVKLEDIIKKGNQYFGKYPFSDSGFRATLVGSLVWFNFLEHMLGATIRLLLDHPIKTFVLAWLSNEAHTNIQKGAMPDYLRAMGFIPGYAADGSGAPLLGKNGLPMGTIASGVNPFATMLQLFVGVVRNVSGQDIGVQRMEDMNPFFKFDSWVRGIDPMAGRAYKDPRLIELGHSGTFVTKETWDKYDGHVEDIPHDKRLFVVRPDMITAFLEIMLPHISKLMRDAKDAPYQASSMTTATEHAPKVRKGEPVLANEPWWGSFIVPFHLHWTEEPMDEDVMPAIEKSESKETSRREHYNPTPDVKEMKFEHQ